MESARHHALDAQELEAEGSLAPDERALLRCRLAKGLESSGEYEAAGEMLRPFWSGIGKNPEVAGLGASAAAEVFLRSGVLTGWLASKAKSSGSQEAAKDLISRSLSLFEQAGSATKVSEARVEMAYCYFREGALDEARVLLQEALKGLGAGDDLMTLALLRLAMIEGAATRFNDALRILSDAAPLFEASTNHAVRGSYHNQLAYALQSLGASQNRGDYFDRAIVEFTAASFHFELSGHTRYLAHVENNLGLLLHTLGRFEESHQHLDRARSLFTALGDEVYAAQVDETRAQVLLSEGRPAEAGEVARQACRVFERVGALSLLAEALTTHGKALARVGRDGEARLELERAAASAEQAGSPEVAGLAVLTLCEELSSRLMPAELRKSYSRADQLLARSQSPDILARLRHVARRALDASPPPEAADAPAAPTHDVGTLISQTLGEHQKRVAFTPEAIEAIGRLFLQDGLLTLSELIEQSVAAARPGDVVSADDVEVVAMRSHAPRGTFTQPWAEFSLKEELGSLEKRFIELALKAAGGKISVAARLLGLNHNERLTSIIKSRHPELLAARTPLIPRRRSIIRKPQR